MSINSSFRDSLDQLASAKGKVPSRSGSPVAFRIAPETDFSKPVQFAKALADNGLSLSDAHHALNAMVAEGSVEIVVYPRDRSDFMKRLGGLRLTAQVREPVRQTAS